MPRLYWILGAGAAAGALAWWFFGDPEPAGVVGDIRQAFIDAISGITQGARLTHCPYDKTTGIVPCDPQELADQMGATPDEAALARNIASEQGGSSTAAQALVAHATKNEAARRGISIFQLLTTTSTAHLEQHSVQHAGRFGTQADLEVLVTNADGKQVHPSDRYATTSQDAYAGHLEIARGVLDGSIPDLTGGANQYDNPSGESNPDAVAAKREAAGSDQVTGLDGLDLGDLRFWRVQGVS